MSPPGLHREKEWGTAGVGGTGAGRGREPEAARALWSAFPDPF